MLITLCYLYLWARWGARPAGLIRRTVRRLYRTRCSFTFCGCGGAVSPPARPRRQRRQGPAEERVCLRIGTKVFFTGEAQVPARAAPLPLLRARRAPGFHPSPQPFSHLPGTPQGCPVAGSRGCSCIPSAFSIQCLKLDARS